MNASQDREHLKLLSIFHYVCAGILALFSLFPVLHLIMGIAIVSGAFDDAANGEALPAIFGWIFVVIPGFFILFGLMIASLIAIAGKRLADRRGYTYCLVIAGIECIFMPVGTVLGIFTIIVLMRTSVKQLFGVDLDPGRVD